LIRSSWYAVPAAALSGVSDSATSDEWHRVLAAVVGGAVGEVLDVVGTDAGVVGDTVVDATVTGVDVVGAVFGFDPPRQPLTRAMPAATSATTLRFTGINPQPYTTTHAKMGIHAFCE
jgi:hypothetical protein